MAFYGAQTIHKVSSRWFVDFFRRFFNSWLTAMLPCAYDGTEMIIKFSYSEKGILILSFYY